MGTLSTSHEFTIGKFPSDEGEGGDGGDGCERDRREGGGRLVHGDPLSRGLIKFSIAVSPEPSHRR